MSPTHSNSRPEAVSVLFVCLGNICRSPMAESVYTHLISTSQSSTKSSLVSRIDSAGTIDWHTGKRADPRTLSTLASHGLPTYTNTARQITKEDLDEFDYVIVMDESNLENVRRMGLTDTQRAKVHLYGEFGEGGDKGQAVADPYYGGDDGFESVYQQVTRLGQGLLKHIEARASSG